MKKHLNVLFSLIFLVGVIHHSRSCHVTKLSYTKYKKLSLTSKESLDTQYIVYEILDSDHEYEFFHINSESRSDFTLELYTQNPCTGGLKIASSASQNGALELTIANNVKFIKVVFNVNLQQRVFTYWKMKQQEECNEKENRVNSFKDPLKISTPSGSSSTCITTCNTQCNPHYESKMKVGMKYHKYAKAFSMPVENQGIYKLKFSSVELENPVILKYAKKNGMYFFVESLDLSSEDGYLLCSDFEEITLIVADKLGKQGSFKLCIESFPVKNSCVNFFEDNGAMLKPIHTSLNSPLDGPYLEGEVVSFSYVLKDWMPINHNWFHGLHVMFSDGWKGFARDSLSDIPIYSLDTINSRDTIRMGENEYTYVEEDTVNVSGLSVPGLVAPGWYFDGITKGPQGGSPKFRWGQKFDRIRSSLDDPLLQFNFSLIADSLDNCSFPKNTTVSVLPYSDSETGRYEVGGCSEDIPIEVNSVIKCCDFGVVHSLADTSLCVDETLAIGTFSNYPSEYRYGLLSSNIESIPWQSDDSLFVAKNTGLDTITYQVEVIWRDSLSDCEEIFIFFVEVKPTINLQRIVLGDLCDETSISSLEIVEQYLNNQSSRNTSLEIYPEKGNEEILISGYTEGRIMLRNQDNYCLSDLDYRINPKRCEESEFVSIKFVPNPAYQQTTMVIKNETDHINIDCMILNDKGQVMDILNLQGNGTIELPYHKLSWTPGLYTAKLVIGNIVLRENLILIND